jgi:hypothetical protein
MPKVIVLVMKDFKAIFMNAAVVMVMIVVDLRAEINQCMIQINIAGIVKLLIMIFMFVASMQENKSKRRILVMRVMRKGDGNVDKKD